MQDQSKLSFLAPPIDIDEGERKQSSLEEILRKRLVTRDAKVIDKVAPAPADALPENVRSTPANTLDDLEADFLTKYGAAVKGIIAGIGTTWWLCNLIAEFGSWTGPAIILNFSWATMAVSVLFAVICTVCDRRIHVKQDTLSQRLDNIEVPLGAKLTKKSQMLLTGSTLSDGLGIAGGLTMIGDIAELIIQKNFIENFEFSPWVTLGILAGTCIVGMFAVLSERRTHKKVLLQYQELDKGVSQNISSCGFFGGCVGRRHEPEVVDDSVGMRTA